MSDELSCYRCGAGLAELTPPLSRQDECPSCSVYLHVCRMCESFAAHVPKQCTEDDAEEVSEKERPNFCDWFKPVKVDFNAQRANAAIKAQDGLAALFGEGEEPQAENDELQSDAEDLFR